jgi:uncharacterized membrane protein (DUF485 family)
MSISLTNKIEKFSTVLFVLLFTVLAEILTAFMNALLSVIFWGKISPDLLYIGSIDALIVSLAVSSVGIYLIRKNANLTTINQRILDEMKAREQAEGERERLIAELQKAIAEIKTLSGMLPICASCKKIRDDKGYWSRIETYISNHTDAVFTHGTCPECAEKAVKEIEEFKKTSGH